MNDHSWTAAFRRAEIVLSCTTLPERADFTFYRRDPELVRISPVMPPIVEAGVGNATLASLAKRLGVGPSFTDTRNTEGWLRDQETFPWQPKAAD